MHARSFPSFRCARACVQKRKKKADPTLVSAHVFHSLFENLVHFATLPLEFGLEHRDVSVLLLLEGHDVALVTSSERAGHHNFPA